MRRKVSVYTRDGHNASSSYYRVLQYTDELSKEDSFFIKERIFVPKFLTKLQYDHGENMFIVGIYHIFIMLSSTYCFLADLVWHPDSVLILRSITPKTFFGVTSFLYKKVVNQTEVVIWDFDDDIFNSNEISLGERKLLEQNASYISVTHSYLSELLRTDVQGKVIQVPTTDNDFVKENKEIIDYRMKEYPTNINVVWVGSSASIKYLSLYQEGLNIAAKELLSMGKILNVIVVSNIPFKSEENEYNLFNIKWTRERAISAMKKAHIGIMPLSNGIFEKGKGSFKLIQYMANSIPVIGSDVGFNSTVINEDFGFLTDDSNSRDFVRGILEISTDIERWKLMAQNAHLEWENNYSYKKNYLIIKKMLQAGGTNE